jgi:malonyl-CoA/methylmalonyl-CoA synthetase
MTELPLIARARTYADAIALRSASGERTYNELLECSATLAVALLADEDDLQETRVAFLVPGGFEYITVQWAIWRAGGVAVPLSMSATESELEYVLADSVSHCVVAPRELAARVASLCDRLELQLVVIEDVPAATAIALHVADLPRVELQRRAMILYTSGTTAQPKGVVSTHANIQSQIEALVEAWSWQATDCIPLFLPLHHIHGIINVVCCALWSGGTIEPLGRFDIDTVLKRVAADAYSVFMAVPTIYVKLIQALEALPAETRAPIVSGFGKMRLMVSGSAALPASVHETWTELTGQRLLERYGMTETRRVSEGQNREALETRRVSEGQNREAMETRRVSEGQNREATETRRVSEGKFLAALNH